MSAGEQFDAVIAAIDAANADVRTVLVSNGQECRRMSQAGVDAAASLDLTEDLASVL